MWKSLYPFTSHWHDLGEVRQHYVDEGRGKPLVMVHGNPTWSFYYRHVIQAFRGSHRTIAPDHVGCGLSDKPQYYSYTLRQHTDNLVRLLEKLDLQQITLLVHDWGGAIGLGAALAVPERFERLVLFNTGAFPPPFVPWRIAACRTPLLGPLAVRGLNLFARAAIRMAVERPLERDVVDGLLAPYNSWAHRIAIMRFVQDIPFSPRHPTWEVLQQLESNLPKLSHLPTTMIWGMRDWCFRQECLERLLKSFPAAQVHRLADAGHYVIEDARDQILAILTQALGTPPNESAPPG